MDITSLLALFFFVVVATFCVIEFGSAYFEMLGDLEEKRSAAEQTARLHADPWRFSLNVFRDHRQLCPESHARRRAVVALVIPFIAIAFLLWALTRAR